MAYTTPRTWANGEIPDEDLLNEQLRDNLNALSTHTHSGAAGISPFAHVLGVV